MMSHVNTAASKPYASEASSMLNSRLTSRMLVAAVMAGALAISGCQSMSRVEQNTLAGGVIGGGLGALTAAAFGASAGWIVVAGAAGAAAGAIYARNTTTNECAVANGNGTYRIVRC